jgi:RNA polymerase sigma-70 factor (ECF subfamily)
MNELPFGGVRFDVDTVPFLFPATRGSTVRATTRLGVGSGGREDGARVNQLVERAQAGDVAAFEALVARTMPDAYRLAVAMVGDDDARDVTQESFVAAWRELPRLRDASKFEPWLRSIVMNRARNALRARRRHPVVRLSEERGQISATEPMHLSQERVDLEVALRRLGAEQRAVVALHYVLDLRLHEVAAALGIPEGTAKSRLHAALRALRAQGPGADR